MHPIGPLCVQCFVCFSMWMLSQLHKHYVNELQKIFCKYIIVRIKKLESAKPEDMSDDEYGFSEKNKKKLQKNLGMWKSTFWNK